MQEEGKIKKLLRRGRWSTSKWMKRKFQDVQREKLTGNSQPAKVPDITSERALAAHAPR